jgi:heme exporter protein D
MFFSRWLDSLYLTTHACFAWSAFQSRSLLSLALLLCVGVSPFTLRTMGITVNMKMTKAARGLGVESNYFLRSGLSSARLLALRSLSIGRDSRFLNILIQTYCRANPSLIASSILLFSYPQSDRAWPHVEICFLSSFYVPSMCH